MLCSVINRVIFTLKSHRDHCWFRFQILFRTRSRRSRNSSAYTKDKKNAAASAIEQAVAKLQASGAREPLLANVFVACRYTRPCLNLPACCLNLGSCCHASTCLLILVILLLDRFFMHLAGPLRFKSGKAFGLDCRVEPCRRRSCAVAL